LSKQEKLLERLKCKPKNFTYNGAVTLLESLGFKKSNKGKTSASRSLFTRGQSKIDFHKSHPRKELHLYQINKLIRDLKKEGLSRMKLGEKMECKDYIDTVEYCEDNVLFHR